MTYKPHPTEKIDLGIDLAKLEAYFNEVVLPLEPVFNGPSYYGWSLVSDTGDYRSGFHHGSSTYRDGAANNQFDQNVWSEKKFVVDTEFDKPTQLCVGYGGEIVQLLKDHGFHPRRVRIVALPPDASTNYHRDHRDGYYWVRLHIPIQTNDACTFENDAETIHMPSDGSAYLVDTACMHRAFNRGTTTRYHFICQVWDTQHRSKYHPYPGSKVSPLERRESF